MRPRPAPRPPDPARVRAVLKAADPPSRQPEAGAAPRPDEVDLMLRRARQPALLSTPHPLATARRSVNATSVVALLALAVAVACLWAVRVLWATETSASGGPGSDTEASSITASGDSDSAATRTGRASFVTATPTTTTGASGASSASGAPQILVHVTGAVLRPGLVRLRSGARVADAVAAAGGAGTDADLESVNLARPLSDGEQIHVPRPGEPARAGPVGGGGSSGSVGGGSGTSSLVDLNTADAAGLDALPGVGPVLAGRILGWRTEHGRFSSVDELAEVPGIGDAMLARLRPLVTVGG